MVTTHPADDYADPATLFRLDRALTRACERLAECCRNGVCPVGDEVCALVGRVIRCPEATPAMWRTALMKEADGE